MAQALPPVVPAANARDRLLRLARAPRSLAELPPGPWEDWAPGLRARVIEEEPATGVRSVLVRGMPGVVVPRHRHLGDEDILVLRGALRDGRAVYRPGDLCHSAQGSVHSEEVVGDEECVCFVVYYGGHEPA
jgi:anti-sigma factor ChrR (cupin superfamily)